MQMDALSFNFFHPQPLIIVISGPSGIGKDAVVKSLKKRNLPIHFVVTVTTRPPRPGEEDGKDYFFISCERFNEMIARGELIEHALVYDQYKGVPKEQVMTALTSGKDVLMRLDVQGAARIRALFPESVLIFLIPSNVEEWFQRIRDRHTESPEDLELRLKTARQELENLKDFDYVVVNAHDQLEKAVDNIVAIITAEHHRVNSRNIRNIQP